MEDEDAPAMAGTVPRQKVTARCKSIDRYGDSDVDLTRKKSFSDEYFKRVARDLKSIPCLLLLGNIFAFVFLIIWSNIAKHIFVSQQPSTATTSSETSQPLIRSIREMHMCHLPRCGAVGHAISYGVNPDVQPCQDMLRHVCSDWIRSDAETYEKMILGSARLYVEDMYKDIKRYLETVPFTGNQLSTQEKVSVFYRKCLYEYRSTGSKQSLLQTLLFDTYELRGWPYETFTQPLNRLLTKFLRRTSEGVLLSVGTARYLPTGRVTDTTRDPATANVLLSLDCPSFHLPIYTILRRDVPFELSYTQFINNTIRAVGIFRSRRIPEALVKNIIATEKNIAAASRKYCHRRQLKPRTIQYLQQRMNITLRDFLRDVIGDSEGRIADSDNILSRSDNYLRYVSTFFHDTRKIVRAVNYVGWRILYFYGKLAFPSILDDELLKITPLGAYNRTPEPDWKRCLMITNDAMPIGLGRVYVEAMLRLKTLFAVQELANKAVFSFKHLLSQAAWMDKAVRERAHEHLAALQTMVGIPKWVANDTFLDEYYRSFGNNAHNSDFFTLFVQATEHTAKTRFLTLFSNRSSSRSRQVVVDSDDKGVNVRPLHSFIFPSRVVDLELRRYKMRQGLIFDVNENSILLPAGILQPPYYDPNAPLAVNYGGLGVLILHDMVNEFFRFYFDAADERWRDRKKCINDNVFRKQDESSGGIDESKEHVVVIFTMMTIRAAYNAYHYALGKDDDDIVPGLGVEADPDQLFMLTAVRTLCSILRDRHHVLVREPEGASMIRKVTSALQGMDELQDAFRCRVGEKRTSYYRCMESERPYTSEGN